MMNFGQTMRHASAADDAAAMLERIVANDEGDFVAKIAAEVENQGAESKATLVLEGNISRGYVGELESFLKAMSTWQAECWVLQLDGLHSLVVEGWLALLNFVRTMQRRGSRVEICGLLLPTEPVLQAAMLMRFLGERWQTRR